MKKVAFYTLGCKLNYSETSTIARKFQEKGFEKVDFTNRPDIFVINTCSVTENADKKCHKVVREARAISPNAFIAIVGCYAQLKPQEIADIPGVDAVLGAAEKFQLLDLLEGFERPAAPKVLASEVEAATGFNASYSLNDRTRTFLKVQDGCDYSCSFCTIPRARGASRSDTSAHIVQSAREIAATGGKGIVLTGVNTGDFGIREGRREERFIDLIRALDHVENIERFRISSIEPNLLNDEIINWIAHSKRFVPHFHIPLQSGSDRMLKLMRRRYQRNLYAARVEKIKAALPDACIGVDVIVGFPGESEADFLETYRFLNELDISYLHVFSYSERDHTLAKDLPDKVGGAEKSERSRMLHILSDKKNRAFYNTQEGKIVNVLFENDVEDGYMHGFSQNYVRIRAPYDPLLINEIVSMKITGILSNLLAEGAEIQAEVLPH